MNYLDLFRCTLRFVVWSIFFFFFFYYYYYYYYFCELIVVKQAGALDRAAVVLLLNHGIYHLDYSPMYLDFFVRYVYPNMNKSNNATGEMWQVSAERLLFVTMYANLLVLRVKIRDFEMHSEYFRVISRYFCEFSRDFECSPVNRWVFRETRTVCTERKKRQPYYRKTPENIFSQMFRRMKAKADDKKKIQMQHVHLAPRLMAERSFNEGFLLFLVRCQEKDRRKLKHSYQVYKVPVMIVSHICSQVWNNDAVLKV